MDFCREISDTSRTDLSHLQGGGVCLWKQISNARIACIPYHITHQFKALNQISKIIIGGSMMQKFVQVFVVFAVLSVVFCFQGLRA